jgi:hypothetical protein
LSLALKAVGVFTLDLSSENSGSLLDHLLKELVDVLDVQADLI